MEEGGGDGAGHPGRSRTLSSEHPPEGVDIGTAGDLEGEDSDQIIEKLSRNEEEVLLGESFLE